MPLMPGEAYLGTFNRSQFRRFVEYAQTQLSAIDARVTHLEAEQARVGTLTFTGDDGRGVPVQYQASPEDSYVAKLLVAYEVLGGNPLIDLRWRQRTQPVFVVKGTEAGSPTLMSNGEAIGGDALSDGISAELVRQGSRWLSETIRYRFASLERKIRRALDYADQLAIEVTQLQIARAAATTNGSLEFVVDQIERLFGDRNYRTIYDDTGSDPLGLKAYAKFSSYEGGGGREVVDPQRANVGYQGPGEGA